MLHGTWSTHYHHPLPEGHRFPMAKYSLLPDQLVREGLIEPGNLIQPPALEEEDILKVHTESYWRALASGGLSPADVRRTGFPWSTELVERERIICRGSIINVQQAMENGVAFNLAGGTHHAYAHRGEGFCLLNDIALAARYAMDHLHMERILVVDLDVHQGNGTASIFQDEPRVFTFSMHGGNNYPLKKEASDLDVALPDGTTDSAYLAALERHLNDLCERVQPQLVFFQAGVDVLETDKLGRLALTRAGCLQRDRMVFSTFKEAQVPVAVSMGGGYSERLADILEAHANTFRSAAEVFS